jgi:hypothetical protein
VPLYLVGKLEEKKQKKKKRKKEEEKKQKKTRNREEKEKRELTCCLSRESLITLDILIVRRVTNSIRILRLKIKRRAF